MASIVSSRMPPNAFPKERRESFLFKRNKGREEGEGRRGINPKKKKTSGIRHQD